MPLAACCASAPALTRTRSLVRCYAPAMRCQRSRTPFDIGAIEPLVQRSDARCVRQLTLGIATEPCPFQFREDRVLGSSDGRAGAYGQSTTIRRRNSSWLKGRSRHDGGERSLFRRHGSSRGRSGNASLKSESPRARRCQAYSICWSLYSGWRCPWLAPPGVRVVISP